MSPTYIALVPVLRLALWGLSTLPETETATVKVRGAGASFPNAVYQAWLPAYRAFRHRHVQLSMTYEPVGSDEGKARIVRDDGSLEYAGSDTLLHEWERGDSRDLVVFPTMAGGAVLAYNLPECGQHILNLTREHVVGIYNGTFRTWNDSSLQEVNPSCQLPPHVILVIARRDRAGTTAIFTEVLSSFSLPWSQRYGVFSDGVDEMTDKPSRWDSSVVTMLGKGNSGMSGLVMSLPHSIAYMSVSTATTVQLNMARIQNRQGNFTPPTRHTVQAAMEARASQNLTVSLADSDSVDAYPMATYTYFIIHTTHWASCHGAKELLRYIDWFMNTWTAREECERRHLVPLSASIRTRVRYDILATVTCNGRYVWPDVLHDIAQENEKSNTWITPVSVTTPLLSLLLLALVAYAAWQRFRLLRMMDKDEWDIPVEDIVFFQDLRRLSGASAGAGGGERGSGSGTGEWFLWDRRSFVSLEDIDGGQQILQQILQWPGRWRDRVVGVRLLELRELRDVNRRTKRTMLWMREELQHVNVLRFYGLMQLEEDRYVIGDYCGRGSMLDILHNYKYNLSNDFKLSLAADIASGMSFLHTKNLVHGSLTSACCLLDAHWTVKVADWEYCRLMTTLTAKKSPTLLLLLEHGQNDVTGGFAASFRQFWVAPEVIRAEFVMTPTTSGDMYSYGIILQEIYTRDDPYVELAETLTPQQVVRAVCSNCLRPEPTEDIPIWVRQMMEIAWSDNPASRPSFEQMLKMLRQKGSSRRTVLDSMMDALEDYTRHLEDQVSQRAAEADLLQQTLHTTLTRHLPTSLLPSPLPSDATGTGRVYEGLGVVMVEVVGMQREGERDREVTRVMEMLNAVCVGVDSVVASYGAYRDTVSADTHTVLVGLDSDSADRLNHCATAAHIALHLIDHVTHITLPSPSFRPPLNLRAGVHVGRVVVGVVGEGAPMLVEVGEGMEVAKALMGTSRAGHALGSGDLVSGLDGDTDFVVHRAGGVMCGSREVESFWISLGQPRKAVSTDSGIDTGQCQPNSLHGDSDRQRGTNRCSSLSSTDMSEEGMKDVSSSHLLSQRPLPQQHLHNGQQQQQEKEKSKAVQPLGAHSSHHLVPIVTVINSTASQSRLLTHPFADNFHQSGGLVVSDSSDDMSDCSSSQEHSVNSRSGRQQSTQSSTVCETAGSM